MLKIFQITQGIDQWLQHYGCSFFSVLFLLGMDLTIAEINGIYYDGRPKIYNEKDQLLWIAFAQFLNSKYETHLEYQGWRDRNYVPKEGEKEILHFYISDEYPDHFVIGDGKGNVAWDPMNNDVAKDSGKLIDKRLFSV